MIAVISGTEDVEIPSLPLSRFVLARAKGLPTKPALIDAPTGRTLTYAQLERDVGRLAAGLGERGLGKGDVVGIYAPNLPEYAVAFHGALTAGCAVTAANPLLTAEELEHQLRNSSARLLVTVPERDEVARLAAARAGIAQVAIVGEPSFDSLLADRATPEVDLDVAEDVAVLPYSSGTTGLPKGVMLTHRNLVANVCQFRLAHDVREQDTVIGVLPFFHIYGMTVVMNVGLCAGATIVTMPRFDLEQFLGAIQDYRVTRSFLVPPIVLALAKQPAVDDFDLSSLRSIFCGAAPLGPELAEACADRLGCRIMQGYGLTETSPVTHAVRDDATVSKPASIGPPVPGTEAMVVDVASGRELPAGEPGEILVRGPQVMSGYLNDPAATAATVDDDGWLHTGDIGTVDEDGWFTIVDRLKELIKYKGFQIAPAELEAVIVTHPGVADAAVIGVADEEAGEVPKGLVVPRGELDVEELMAYVAGRVAPYKKLRLVEIVEGIPRSPSGKILRRLLREA